MNKAKVVEIGPRDGFQNVKEVIPTEVKLHIIDGIIDAGFKKVQIGSFVSPKAIPQMADFRNVAEQVLNKYADSDVEFFCLVPNLKGAQLAYEIGLSIYRGLGAHDAGDEAVLTEILSGLEGYPWPGNIRELSNMMERIHVLRSQGETFDFIRKYDRVLREETEGETKKDPGSPEETMRLHKPQDKLQNTPVPALRKGEKERREMQQIVEALNRHDLEITATAEELGMSRSTLWRKMKKYHIDVR